METFSAALASGVMAQLKELLLYKNQIGDEGMKSFSTVLASGALPQLKVCSSSNATRSVTRA
eukprot:896310-Prymnesium_polylepis.1